MEEPPKKIIIEDPGPEIPFPASSDEQSESLPEDLESRALFKYRHNLPRTLEEETIISRMRDEESKDSKHDNSGGF